jgi:hypothetical protein
VDWIQKCELGRCGRGRSLLLGYFRHKYSKSSKSKISILREGRDGREGEKPPTEGVLLLIATSERPSG